MVGQDATLSYMTNEQWKDETNHLLHTLWGKAVGTQDYDKGLWLRLQWLLEQGADGQPFQGQSRSQAWLWTNG